LKDGGSGSNLRRVFTMKVITNLMELDFKQPTVFQIERHLIIIPYHTENWGTVLRNSETTNWTLNSGLVLERDLGTAFNRVIPYVPKNQPSDSYGEANREVLENGTSGTSMKTDRLFLVEAAI
jgi:hypothetical protein